MISLNLSWGILLPFGVCGAYGKGDRRSASGLCGTPKFTPHTYSEKKMQILWLRFLTEINEYTREIPQDLLDNPELKKAVDALEESAFTDAQLAGYEIFWDMVSVEKNAYGQCGT